MEVTTKSMPYEAWKDNEYIEGLVKELQENGANVVVGSFDKLINWGRSNLFLDPRRGNNTVIRRIGGRGFRPVIAFPMVGNNLPGIRIKMPYALAVVFAGF